MKDNFLTEAEAADYLGHPLETVRTWRRFYHCNYVLPPQLNKPPRIPFIVTKGKLGNPIAYKKSDLDEIKPHLPKKYRKEALR